MKSMAVVLGLIVVFGGILPAAAQVTDYNQPVIYGPGLSWDPNYFGPQKPSTEPWDKAYHQVSEPGLHIAPEAPRAAFAPGQGQATAPAQVACELMQEMHMGL